MRKIIVFVLALLNIIPISARNFWEWWDTELYFKTATVEDVKQDLDAGAYATLAYAAAYGSPEVIKVLIDAGADVNRTDGNGTSPLLRALFNENFEVVTVLINAGAHVNGYVSAHGVFNITPLGSAVLSENLEVVKVLLDAGADLNSCGSMHYDRTALTLAAEHNENLEVIKFLLEAGADVNADHPLVWAIGDYSTERENPNPEIIKVLLDAGVDVNTQAWGGTPPLHWAVSEEASLEVLKVLLEAGANVNARDRDGSTPLHVAVKNGNHEIIKTLIDAGADAKAVDNKGRTPFYLR